MIEKAIAYKKTDKDFISSLKKLGLSKDEINFILKKSKRKKFEDGGDSGGDSGGPGDSGPGGSDDGSGHGGPGPGGQGESTGDANDQGGTVGPGDTSSVGPSDTGFGIGPDAAQDAAQSAAQNISQDDVSMQAQADMEDASRAAAAAEQSGLSRAIAAVKNYAMDPATIGRTLGMATFGIPGAIAGAMIGSNIGRGVTAPDDFSQLDTSVQSGPAQDSSGVGITTINQFAPLINPTTGDNTADAMRARLNSLLDVKPTVYGIPSVNQLSNYNLLDLSNLRK